MTAVRRVRTFRDRFDRAQALSTTPGQNGWTVKDTSASGTPTYLAVNERGGGMKLTLAATSEAEIVTMYQNDVLFLDPRDLHWIEWTLKVAGIDAVTTLVFGLASAQNDTADSVAANAWFRLEGSASLTAILAESDDGTTDNDDKATGKSFGSDYLNFRIDFSSFGIGDLRFFIDGQRVADGVLFPLTAYAGSFLQPFVQLQKASGTGVPSVTIAEYAHQYSYTLGV